MVLEIALGVVLAVLMLVFLPELLGLGVVLLSIALLAAALGLFVHWAHADPAVVEVALVVTIAIGGYLLLSRRLSKAATVRALREQLRRRKALGYDTSALEASLEKAMLATTPITKRNEIKRRKQLGYSDDQNDA